LPARFNPLFVVLALLAGLLLGFAASTFAYRHRLLRVPGEGMVQRMDQILKLSPAQHEQVVEVMEESRRKMGEMHREFQQRRRQLLDQAYAQVRALLTPEQQKEFDRSFKPAPPRHWGHQPPPEP
jgi:Spy/CpxP family protein refolding chaperone